MPKTFYVEQPDFIDKLNALWSQVQTIGSPIIVRGPQGLQGPRGFTGARGLQGFLGVNGSKIYSGRGVPVVGLGVNGDYYLDKAHRTLWGPKALGAWIPPPLDLGADGVRREPFIVLSNGNASNDLDWSAYGTFEITCTGTSCALNHLNLPGTDGKLGSMLGLIHNGGNADVAVMFPGVIWSSHTAPAMATIGFSFVSLWCFDTSQIYGVATDMS